MLHLSSHCRYFLYTGITDMRRHFDSLSGMVTSGMQQNGLGWDIFIFLNRRRNQIKLLLFEGDGFAIYHKRLEKGTYFWRKCEQIDKVQKQKSLQIKGFAGF